MDSCQTMYVITGISAIHCKVDKRINGPQGSVVANFTRVETLGACNSQRDRLARGGRFPSNAEHPIEKRDLLGKRFRILGRTEEAAVRHALEHVEFRCDADSAQRTMQYHRVRQK